MAIKRFTVPHMVQHNKSEQGLKKAGLYGLLITGDGDKVAISFVGNLEKALAVTHMAFNGNPLLRQIAEMVSGPKIEVSKGGEEPVMVPYDIPVDEVKEAIEQSLKTEE